MQSQVEVSSPLQTKEQLKMQRTLIQGSKSKETIDSMNDSTVGNKESRFNQIKLKTHSIDGKLQRKKSSEETKNHQHQVRLGLRGDLVKAIRQVETNIRPLKQIKLKRGSVQRAQMIKDQ